MHAHGQDRDVGRLGVDDEKAAADDRLDAPHFAWEFLRRNIAYAEDYARTLRSTRHRLDPKWGLRFPVDPAVAAPTAEVFWRPDAAPGLVVPVAPAGSGAGMAIPLPSPDGGVRVAEDGLHMRTRHGLQLILSAPANDRDPIVVLLTLDADFRDRVAAAEALYHLARDGGAPPPRLSAPQRQRLRRALVALDAFTASATYRDIAARLFGDAEAARDDWRTSSMRAATIRLVQLGQRLSQGGYRALLRGAP